MAYYGEDGSLNFHVPNREAVRFEITPYDDGEMTVTVEEVRYDSGEMIKTMVYPDLQVKKNKALSMAMNTGLNGKRYEAVFLDPEGKPVQVSYEITPETEEYYEITLKTSGNGAAYGGGEAVKGAFTELYAVPQDDDTVFTGWFDEKGVLITTDEALSYRGWNDAVLEARFEKKDGQTAPTEPATAASIEDVARYYGIEPVSSTLVDSARTAVACYRALVQEHGAERQAKGEDYWERYRQARADEEARTRAGNEAMRKREQLLNRMNGMLWICGGLIFISLIIQLYQRGGDMSLMVVFGIVAVFAFVRGVMNLLKK